MYHIRVKEDTSMWKPAEVSVDQKENGIQILEDLKSGKIPAIIVKNFYDKESCMKISKRSKNHLNFKKNMGIVNDKIGVSLVQFRNEPAVYFEESTKMRILLRRIFDGLEDPRKKIHLWMSNFANGVKVQIAMEGENRYGCGIIRLHKKGSMFPIHRDNASFETPHFLVGKLKEQISFVLPVQSPEYGGELQIFKQFWEKTDEEFRRIDFGYYDKVVDRNCESVSIKPELGNLIIINPNYYHRILPVFGRKNRITLSMFAGFIPNEKTVLTWS